MYCALLLILPPHALILTEGAFSEKGWLFNTPFTFPIKPITTALSFWRSMRKERKRA